MRTSTVCLTQNATVVAGGGGEFYWGCREPHITFGRGPHQKEKLRKGIGFRRGESKKILEGQSCFQDEEKTGRKSSARLVIHKRGGKIVIANARGSLIKA